MAAKRRSTGRSAAGSRGSQQWPGQAAPDRGRTALFVAAIGGSSFLLFSLELLTGRLVLPAFGGSPGVWTTALAFFTAVLFIGYLYAHLLTSRLGLSRGRIVHLAVAGVALLGIILAPRDVASLRSPGLPEAINVLLALSLLAGLPAFLLATTTPVLSTWFADHGQDPWWLYAASNAASLGGLLAYPFLIEPTIPLSVQRVLLAGGIGLFVALLVVIVLHSRLRHAGPPDRPAASPNPPAPRLGPWRPLRWLIAAFVPAGLLSATTAFLATDLVSAPLIWVGPLAIYLGSLVVAFSARGRRVLPVVEWLVPAAATVLWVPYVAQTGWPLVGLLILIFGSYGILATALHGRLALDRPDERHLTLFYLVLSAGGLLATAFVALVAPLIFDTIYEYPLLLVGGIAALAILPGPARRPGRGRLVGLVADAARRVAPLAVVGVLVFLLLVREHPDTAAQAGVLLGVGGAVVALAWRPAVLAAGTGVLIVVLLVVLAQSGLVARVRSFFGVIEVVTDLTTLARSEYSGTTLHGLQFLDARSSEPTTYYVRSGPLGDAFDDLRARTTDPSIAVVGLGTGTTAAYSQAGDTFAFYEINQAAIDIARDPALFTYLSDAPIPIRIVLGDARLSLAAEPDDSIDLLVLDAFSSDAVPAHLLTREAMAEYDRVLRPGGIAAFHLSNRYYELTSAVASTATSIGLASSALQYLPGPANEARFAARSTSWVIIGHAEDVARYDARGWLAPVPGPLLTDDFFDTLRLLRPDVF